MADKELVARLKKGTETWNAWRKKNPEVMIDLSGADLTGATLSEANLSGADLSRVNLTRTNLFRATLSRVDLTGVHLPRAFLAGADLTEANLTRTNLIGANLSGVNLSRACLFEADLAGTNLAGTNLAGANLAGASLGETLFGNTNLTDVQGLDSCRHLAPSTIDHRTLQLSGPLPLAFLRGCGLPEAFIDYLPSLLRSAPRQFPSCFISYSHHDKAFAHRLYADLQDKGVRC
jgi:hypothetical protein